MTRLRSRAAREAAVILGRAAVEAALSGREGVAGYILANPGAVRDAARALRAYLPGDVPGAVAYAAGLDPVLRVALAGAWADRATARVLAGLGVEEQP